MPLKKHLKAQKSTQVIFNKKKVPKQVSLGIFQIPWPNIRKIKQLKDAVILIKTPNGSMIGYTLSESFWN